MDPTDAPAAGAPRGLLDALLDLVVGSGCTACGRPGRVLCPPCEAALPRTARPARPTPCPPGLPPTWAGGDHDGALRALVVGHKEEGRLALARPLGAVLAASVLGALAASGVPGSAVLLVPVPSRPGADRARGHAPTVALVARAAVGLEHAGVRARVAPLLVSRGGVADQAGLGAAARAANLAGSMACRTDRLRREARRRAPVRVVLCDDVLTTGATLLEAARALRAVGVEPAGAAVVAATVRRRPPGRVAGGGTSAPDPAPSLPSRGPCV